MILRTVEYFTSHSLEMPEECSTSAAKGDGQKSMPPGEGGGPSSKAAAFLMRGAYSQYVSPVKSRPACAKRFGEGRERHWRLFSTFPFLDLFA